MQRGLIPKEQRVNASAPILLRFNRGFQAKSCAQPQLIDISSPSGEFLAKNLSLRAFQKEIRYEN